MTLRYEQRARLASDVQERVQLSGRAPQRKIADIIEAIEVLGFRITTPTEPMIGRVLLSETLKRDARDALIDAAVSMEQEAARRTNSMRAAMLRRAEAMRRLADTLSEATRAVDGDGVRVPVSAGGGRVSNTDPLAPLRLFADMREARLKLIGLDTPDVNARARLIRDPGVYKALSDLLYAAEKLVAAPHETDLFWHPVRESFSAAEKRFDAMRARLK